uniref:Uncharacterized protein n=1 Tax=Fagus sylvatica TaxID=28930 RepID=A0A2N9H7P4_FAGSY
MLPANREFHVVAGVVIFPTHPGSRINLLRVRKDSAREGGCPGEKRVLIFPAHFSLQILSQFARVFDLAPDVGFRRSWYRWKACAAYFCKVPDLRKSELGTCEIWSPRTEVATGVFLVRLRAFFRSRIPARPRKTLRASVATSVGKVPEIFSTALFRRPVFTYRPCTEASLGSQDMILRTGGRWNVPYAKGFAHNSLVSRPFLARKVSNRSSHHALQNGQGAVSSIQLSVWSTVRSNLGQTWSTLGQTWSNLVKTLRNSGKCIPDHVLRVLGIVGPQSDLRSWGYLMWRALVGSGRLGSGCLVLRADTRENPGGTAKNLPQFTVSLSVRRAGSQSVDTWVKNVSSEVVVAEIIAGPHALDSCECMNIEDAMRASIEVVVALSAGSGVHSHPIL